MRTQKIIIHLNKKGYILKNRKDAIFTSIISPGDWEIGSIQPKRT